MTTPTWLPLAISASGTVIALSAFAYQVHRARFNQSVDLLFKLEGAFLGAGKVAQRSLAARKYLADANDFIEMEDVLDFFETIAMLTRKKALDVYLVWHTFDYWIERYCAVAKPRVQARQVGEPGVWEDLDWLLPRLRKLQASKGGSELNEMELQRFLVEESLESR